MTLPVLPLAGLLGCLFFASERLLAWRRHSSRVADGTALDGGTLRVLWVTALSAIAAGLLVTFWRLGPPWPPGFPWQVAGATIFLLGTALRWWAIVHLGRFFTVDITVSRDHRVIADGPYRYVRHPSYTGLLLQYVGWAMSLNNVLALPVVFAPVFLSLRRRMRLEEAALTSALGEDYAAYCLRTKRLVPLIY